MKLKKIHLKVAHTEQDIEPLVKNNVQPTDKDFDILVTEYCTVYKPNGEILLKLVPGAIAHDYCVTAFDAFEGRLSDIKNSNRAAMVASQNKGSEGVIGSMDPLHRFNYCRQTALTINNLNGYKASLPFIRSAATLMKAHMPERYEAQLQACKAGQADYIIPSTPFSTVTINRDVTAAYHTDQGDYRPGIGIIAATWAEKTGEGWEITTENPAAGGLLVFPRYRVAVRIQTQDVVLCDVHEVHGVTPIVGVVGQWARMSFVFYLREKIVNCPSMTAEIARINAKDTKTHREKDDPR